MPDHFDRAILPLFLKHHDKLVDLLKGLED